MKLQLLKAEHKNWMLWATELTGDQSFVPYRECYLECPDSQRWTVDRIVREETRQPKLMVFNQCRVVGVTAWEFWDGDQGTILDIAMRIAERLGVELEL